MRRAPALLLCLLALAAGCGDDANETGDPGLTEPGPLATDACLAERGFSMRPAASGVSAVSPDGVELTIVFFDTEDEAAEAADRSDDATAVANAVVTTEGTLSSDELADVEECVRGETG